MPSRRLSLVNALARALVRRHLARTRDPARARREFARAMAIFTAPPPFVAICPEPRMEWVFTARSDARRVILYFHGGGYITGSPATHRAITGRLAVLSGLRVAAAAYRLAPEHPAPAQFEDAVRAFGALLARGYAPEGIVLAGDSAGGGLALALLAHLCATGQRPAGLIAFSPWTDLALTGDSLSRNAASERLLPVSRIEELVAHVAPRGLRTDPRVSPLYAEFDGPPPVQIHVAETEILADDALRMAERLRRAGGVVDVVPLRDAPHVWQFLDGWVPEAHDSLLEAARFARRVTSLPAPAAGS